MPEQVTDQAIASDLVVEGRTWEEHQVYLKEDHEDDIRRARRRLAELIEGQGLACRLVEARKRYELCGMLKSAGYIERDRYADEPHPPGSFQVWSYAIVLRINRNQVAETAAKIGSFKVDSKDVYMGSEDKVLVVCRHETIENLSITYVAPLEADSKCQIVRTTSVSSRLVCKI